MGDCAVGKDVMFNIKVFQIKAVQTTNKIDVTLPDRLGAYRNLVREDPSDENKLSPYYHKQLYSKTISLKNTGDVVKNIEKHLTLKWTFRNQVVRIDPTQIADDQEITQQYGAQNCHKFGNPADKLWMVLSTSNNSNSQVMDISVMRTDVWRDQHGVITR